MADIQEELYRKAIENAGNWLADPKTVILDTETTDLGGFICEIAIIDTQGNELLNTLVKPNAPISPGASRIHGHTATSLADAPVFAQIVDKLLETIQGRRVVIYNSGFDTQILMNELRRFLMGLWEKRAGALADDIAQYTWVERRVNELMGQSTWDCAMLAYSDFVGQWNDYHGNNRWQRLPGGDHSALGDCRATLKVLKEMAAAAEPVNLQDAVQKMQAEIERIRQLKASGTATITDMLQGFATAMGGMQAISEAQGERQEAAREE